MISSGKKNIYMRKKHETAPFYSMVAEIGGYSGLLIGFSLMDIVSLYRTMFTFFRK